MDWFLFDRDLRHEKFQVLSVIISASNGFIQVNRIAAQKNLNIDNFATLKDMRNTAETKEKDWVLKILCINQDDVKL